MESLLIVSWLLSVLVAGELTIWKLRYPGKSRSLLGITLPFMLLGHPLWWLVLGVGGAVNVMQAAAGRGGIDLMQAAICTFTGLCLAAYMLFRFMTQADQRLRT